jgi:hypothetical protein
MKNIKYKEFEIWESNDSGHQSISSGIPLLYGYKPFIEISHSGDKTVVKTLEQAIELMKSSIDLFLNGEIKKRRNVCLNTKCFSMSNNKCSLKLGVCDHRQT